MASKVYSVRCLLQKTFEPVYDNYSSYEEVILLVPDLSVNLDSDRPISAEQVSAYVRPFIEESYINSDGCLLQSRLFHIAGIQEVDDRVCFDTPFVEVYRWFYQFNRHVSAEMFLEHYYFDDLGVGGLM